MLATQGRNCILLRVRYMEASVTVHQHQGVLLNCCIKSVSADSLTPCQSTGVSFIKAGASTQRFLDEFVAELLANTPGWWEQAAYNEV